MKICKKMIPKLIIKKTEGFSWISNFTSNLFRICLKNSNGQHRNIRYIRNSFRMKIKILDTAFILLLVIHVPSLKNLTSFKGIFYTFCAIWNYICGNFFSTECKYQRGHFNQAFTSNGFHKLVLHQTNNRRNNSYRRALPIFAISHAFYHPN